MKVSQGIRLAALTLGLAVGVACGHQSSVPVIASGAVTPDNARLPFDRAAQDGGISPTSSVVPPGAQVPSGTAFTVHLKRPLSSARAHSNDTFAAVLEEPVLVNNQVLAEAGAFVTGRVVEARPTNPAYTPGYMRLTLTSISINGKPVRVRTSSTFLKGTGPRRRFLPLPTDSDEATLGNVMRSNGTLVNNALVEAEEDPPVSLYREAIVGTERRLRFRLIEPLPIRP
jgi:hypothetical protein